MYLITEDFVKSSIKKYLQEKGWSNRYHEAPLSGRGADIIVKNDKAERWYFIEAKGESEKRGVNTNNIIFALGQICSRMKVIASNAYLYGIALPQPLALKAIIKILHKFVKHNTLKVLSVDKNGNVEEYSGAKIKRMIEKGPK